MTIVRPRARGPWTYQRLCAATGEDMVRREIIDGWLYLDGHRTDDPYAEVAAESGRPIHQDVVRELLAAFLQQRHQHGGQVYTAPLDVAFGDHVLQPDVFWLPRSAPRHALPVAILPTLVVEVSSPSTRRHDLVRKRRIYEESGVPEYWFVDTDAQRVERYVHVSEGAGFGDPTLVTRGATVTSASLPGFEVDVDALFGPEGPDDM